MKTYYYIPNIFDGETPDIENAYEFRSERDIHATDGGYDRWEVEWLVEETASDYVDNHDGWEIANRWCGYERTFVLWDENKNLVGEFDVLLEYEPIFRANRKK
jgi:hypothetical protein